MRNQMPRTFKLMMLLLLAMTILNLVACGGGAGNGGSTSASPAPTNPTSPVTPIVPIVGPNPTPAPNGSVALTYYTLSKTVAPVNGWPTKQYTAMAACVQFENNTFCWDDGIKTLQWTSNNNNYGPYTYDYWGVTTTAQGWGLCNGGCVTDFMIQPIYMSQSLVNNITLAKITQVFTQGTPKQVSCTESNNILDCVDFAINMNQSPL